MIRLWPLREQNTVLYEIEEMWSMGRFERDLYTYSSYVRRQQKDLLLDKQLQSNVFE